MIKDVVITPLKIIEMEQGNVLHAMKASDQGFSGFGEAYFSTVKAGSIKGWKRHRQMTLNLVVPVGAIRFVIFDDRNGEQEGVFQEVVIGQNNYCRLTVPPMVWMGFQGVSEDAAMLLNVANIMHDPSESDRKSIEKIQYKWGSI